MRSYPQEKEAERPQAGKRAGLFNGMESRLTDYCGIFPIYITNERKILATTCNSFAFDNFLIDRKKEEWYDKNRGKADVNKLSKHRAFIA